MFYEEEGILTQAPSDEEILGPIVIGPTTELVISSDEETEDAVDAVDPLEQLFADLGIETEIAPLQSSEADEDEDDVEETMVPVAVLEDDASPTHLALARRALVQARDMIGSVIELLDEDRADEAREMLSSERMFEPVSHRRAYKAYEGVFDGVRMVGADGSVFEVPPNYASKSRLVEGDILKLSILSDGSHRYKQISPAPRERIVGLLACDEMHGGHCLLASGNRYRLLDASVAFYRGRPGDEVVGLVPKDTSSRYAAVEVIVHKA